MNTTQDSYETVDRSIKLHSMLVDIWKTHDAMPDMSENLLWSTNQ